MSFSIQCNRCNSIEEKQDNFPKKDSISVEIIGDYIVRITCGVCNNEIISVDD